MKKLCIDYASHLKNISHVNNFEFLTKAKKKKKTFEF